MTNPWDPDWSWREPPISVPSVPSVPVDLPSATTVAQAVEQAAASAAAKAAQVALPDLLKQIGERVQSEITEALGGATNQPVPPSLDDFTKASARSRAIRTFFVGLGLSVIWGVVNVIGALSGVNFFDKTALTSVLSILVSSVVASVCSYVLRIRITPNYGQAGPPGDLPPPGRVIPPTGVLGRS